MVVVVLGDFCFPKDAIKLNMHGTALNANPKVDFAGPMKPKSIILFCRRQKFRSLVLADYFARHFQIAFYMVTSVSMHKQVHEWVRVIYGPTWTFIEDWHIVE